MKTSHFTNPGNFLINTLSTIKIESDDSEEEDTIPDEDFKIRFRKNLDKKISWPNEPNKDKDSLEGPNINIKMPRRSYSSREEKCYFYNKIKIKKKTELCKNWSLYTDCKFKQGCSFAHGDVELRCQNDGIVKYKTKVCKMFSENLYCNYGNRCIYLHIIKVGRVSNYNYILKQEIKDLFISLQKPENHNKEMWKIIHLLKLRKQFIIPRLSIFETITSVKD